MPSLLGEDMPGQPSLPALTTSQRGTLVCTAVGDDRSDNLTELAPLEDGVNVVRPR